METKFLYPAEFEDEVDGSQIHDPNAYWNETEHVEQIEQNDRCIVWATKNNRILHQLAINRTQLIRKLNGPIEAIRLRQSDCHIPQALDASSFWLIDLGTHGTVCDSLLVS